jgi:phage-related protein
MKRTDRWFYSLSVPIDLVQRNEFIRSGLLAKWLAIVLTLSMDRVIKFYRTASGRCPVEEFLDGLDERALVKVLAVFKLIETQELVPAQYFKKLSGYKLWEARMSLSGQAYRFLGFWDKGALIILTHGFRKKSQRTPDQEIRKALDYRADWEGR